jgi:hypothetical protein
MLSADLPWYRYPIVWLVIAIPLLTVPAGLTTVWVAMRGADVVVADDFRVDGLAINRDPVRDAAARALAVHATLSVAEGSVTVALREGGAAVPARLVLLLSHATRATEDREVRLARTGERTFAGDLGSLAAGHWYLELAPPDRAWRLTGDFRQPPQALELAPRQGP